MRCDFSCFVRLILLQIGKFEWFIIEFIVASQQKNERLLDLNFSSHVALDSDLLKNFNFYKSRCFFENNKF